MCHSAESCLDVDVVPLVLTPSDSFLVAASHAMLRVLSDQVCTTTAKKHQ